MVTRREFIAYGFAFAGAVVVPGCNPFSSTNTTGLEDILQDKAKNNQVIVFGTIHSHDKKDQPLITAQKDFVNTYLPTLRKEHYTELAVEIYKEMQPLIDQYQSGHMDEKQLVASIPNLEEACGKELLTHANFLGMKIHAFDTSQYRMNIVQFYLDAKTGYVDEILYNPSLTVC